SVSSLVNSCDLNGQIAQCYLNEFNNLSPKPAFIVATGDISNVGNSNPPMYHVLTQFLYPDSVPNPGIGVYHIDAAQKIPIYFTPGNHDYYTTLYPPGSLTQSNYLTNYAQYIGPDTDYAVTDKISVILFMRSGNDIPYWNELDPFTPDGSGLTDGQCAWIRKELALNSTKRKIIVMHHPPENLAGTNCDGTPYTSQTILDPAAGSLANNRTTFLNICDSNKVDMVLAGHQHQNVVTDVNGNMISENCDSCGTRYVQTGAAFNGCYRIVTVSPTFVSITPPLQSCVTGINEISYSLNTLVYPSINAGTFSVAVDDDYGYVNHFYTEIYNTMGQKVSEETIAGKKGTIRIKVPNGIYFIHIKTDRGAEGNQKVIISH
ncbi:MAG TPA: metallophosphoesterase, partial [Bacteroidia bacterium]|nr:metallophosphoesterase [Bacteroidia bacterium]